MFKPTKVQGIQTNPKSLSSYTKQYPFSIFCFFLYKYGATKIVFNVLFCSYLIKFAFIIITIFFELIFLVTSLIDFSVFLSPINI